MTACGLTLNTLMTGLAVEGCMSWGEEEKGIASTKEVCESECLFGKALTGADCPFL
jgi:hypothetical protein